MKPPLLDYVFPTEASTPIAAPKSAPAIVRPTTLKLLKERSVERVEVVLRAYTYPAAPPIKKPTNALRTVWRFDDRTEALSVVSETERV